MEFLMGLLDQQRPMSFSGKRTATPYQGITAMDAAKFVAEATPILGDAMAAKEIYDELTNPNPNYGLVLALGGASLVGLVPGLGDALASGIKKGARGLLDVADRIEVDPSAMGSTFANVKLRPKAVTKKELDPAGLSNVTLPDYVENLERTFVPTKGLLEPEKVVDISDFQGRVAIPAYWDRTYGGGLLTGVGDMKFERPVDMMGGGDFMRQTNTGLGASEFSAIKDKNTLINEIIKKEGTKPLKIFTSMGGQSGDFSHHMADTMMNMIDFSKITKAGAKKYDDFVKDKIDPKWPGILNPKTREYLYTDMSGTKRRELWQNIDKRFLVEEGFPMAGIARAAITDKRLQKTDPFASGLYIGEATGGDLITPDKLGNKVPHKSYDTQVEGNYLGGLEDSIPGEMLWTEFFDKRRQLGIAPAGDQRSFMLSPYIRTEIDQKKVDDISTYLENKRRGLLSY
jgi:hypothetical protein